MERAVIVTGASSGIGEGIAQRLVEKGRTVVSIQRTAPPWSHERLHFLPCDLADAEAARAAGSEAVSKFEIEGLVNNAGQAIARPAEQFDLEAFSTLFAVHVQASLLLMQAVIPGMRERRFGRIVNIGSRAMLGKRRRTGYAATKAGLLAMTRVWALEFAADGITCNMVAPGSIDTPMLRKGISKGAAFLERISKDIPVGRVGTPEDVAHAVEFFLSEGAGFITGQVLYVCGGMSIGAAPL
jgi:3-oxoacyl-[acyl-carrier protein] reductase